VGKNSKIAWTTNTFNPWVGCQRVSPGCENCYAETLMHRYGREVWGPDAPRERTTDANWRKPLAWDREAREADERVRVFCASLADVFEDRRDLDAWRLDLWKLIASTTNTDGLLLTKRPEQMTMLSAPSWRDRWPENAWAGTTTENQKWFDKRLGHLLAVPAKIRFLSIEPIVGPIDLAGRLDGIHWVIVGAESGHGARAMDHDWVRSIRDQTKAAGAAFFYKQDIVDGKKVELPEIDGRSWGEIPGYADAVPEAA
jgi:protein gp37